MGREWKPLPPRMGLRGRPAASFSFHAVLSPPHQDLSSVLPPENLLGCEVVYAMFDSATVCFRTVPDVSISRG